MTIHDLKILFQKELSTIYPKNEIESFYHILTEFKLGLSRVEKALHPNQIIKKATIPFFEKSISLLKSEKPIQHITEKTEFFGLPFAVNSSVLIPRPETEELVQWTLESSSTDTPISILDIGTGSGCIAIALAKKLPNAQVTGIDVSTAALSVAKKNAILNKVAIDFIQKDILRATKLSKGFDIIISNPPYVREAEKQEIKKNVLSYEPHSALFVPDENPLLFYNKIAELAKTYLKPNGQLFFEINQYLGKETMRMLAEKGFTSNELRTDIFGNARMTKSRF